MNIRTLLLPCALPLLAQRPPVPDVAFFKQDPKALMVACADAARSYPDRDSRHLVACGDAYLAGGDRAKAEECFSLAAGLDPKDGNVFQRIFDSWMAHGYRKEALAVLDRLKLDGLNSRDLAQSGGRVLGAGDRPLAEELFALAVRNDPGDGETHQIIAHAWLSCGYRPEALAAYFRMRQDDPGATAAGAQAALDLLEVGLEKDAIATMDLLRRQEPREYEAFTLFAEGALRLGHKDLAATWFARSAQARPKEAKVWAGISKAYATALAPRPSAPATPVVPRPAQEALTGRAIWTIPGFTLTVSEPKGLLGGAGGAFNDAFKDRPAFVAGFSEDVLKRLPGTKSLPSTALLQDPSTLGALGLHEEDRILTIEDFQVFQERQGKGMRGKTNVFFAAARLTLYSGKGQRLRSVPFLEADVSSWYSPDPIARSIAGRDDRSMREVVRDLKRKMVEFLESDTFKSWTN